MNSRMRFIYFISLMMTITTGKAQLTYLALGDSYTIGEAVPFWENFPNQAVKLMRAAGQEMDDAEIIAKTGWTTFELSAHLDQYPPKKAWYDFVSLLIGVNNQYRGLSADIYSREFRSLLMRAISYAKGHSDRVVVLSIPDWGVTPFAKGRDRAKISGEIDIFNALNKKITEDAGVHYIDITPWTREAATDASLLAKDGLHPGAKDYARWAERVAAWMLGRLGE